MGPDLSQSAERYKRRGKGERYRDLCRLPPDEESPIVFLGGKNHVPLFCALTSRARGERTVFYNGAPPEAPGCTLVLYRTSTKTNWHYECAEALVEGRLHVSSVELRR